MTEDEAKTKWCPHVRIADEGGTWNRAWRFFVRKVAKKKERELVPMCRCIGSGCMAWRWKWNSDGGDAVEQHNKPSGEGSGYCGLAGRP